jgi:putative transposase
MPIRSFPIKLIPNATQKVALESILGICAKYYNHACIARKIQYENNLPFLKNGELEKLSILQKPELDPNSIMHSQIVQDICKRNTLAFEQFFERLKDRSKQAPGLPKEKVKSSKSFCLKQFGYSIIYNKGAVSKIKFWRSSGLGSIKVHRKVIPNGAKVKTLIVIRKADGYYAILTCEVPLVKRIPSKSAKVLSPYCMETTNLVKKQDSIGIDMGITDFITLSDGKQINCNLIKLHEKELDSLNKALRRKKKKNPDWENSRRCRKIQEKIEKKHLKIKRVRLDFQNKASNYVLGNFENIQIEDLDISSMIKSGKKFGRKFRRRIHGAAWGNFVRILDYKAELYGTKVNKINPMYTSQMCICGAYVPKKLKERKHSCDECGMRSGRDQMASKVIEILGNVSHKSHKKLVDAQALLELNRRSDLTLFAEALPSILNSKNSK